MVLLILLIFVVVGPCRKMEGRGVLTIHRQQENKVISTLCPFNNHVQEVRALLSRAVKVALSNRRAVLDKSTPYNAPERGFLQGRTTTIK